MDMPEGRRRHWPGIKEYFVNERVRKKGKVLTYISDSTTTCRNDLGSAGVVATVSATVRVTVTVSAPARAPAAVTAMTATR